MLTRLSYVGGRPYIRGADLYRWFERQIAGRAQAIDSFKLLREVRRDGAWVGEKPSEPAASIDYLTAAGERRAAWFDEQGAIITATEPDVERALLDLDQTGDFAGAARMRAPADTVALVNALIEANKALHVRTLDGRKLSPDSIRLVYVEHLPTLSAPLTGELLLRFRHLGERAGRDRRYTLNAVQCPGATRETRICYSY
ncbi:MAG: hypothetical protein ACM3N5_15420 [Candidatus Eiseniibacteriota bacterium]